MKNLENSNVLVDYGVVDYLLLDELECREDIRLPTEYKDFILHHNGASLMVDSFDFYDTDIEDCNSASLAFIQVQKISKFLKSLKAESVDDPNYFPRKLIPFGDDGGGNYMCFDYRNHNGNNPPIIYWNHDVYENDKRISFIANNFEEFINMLHEPED